MTNEEVINEKVVRPGFAAKTLGRLTHERRTEVTKNPVVLKEADQNGEPPLIGIQVIEIHVEKMSGGLISQVKACSEEVEEIVLGLPMSQLVHARLSSGVIKTINPSK